MPDTEAVLSIAEPIRENENVPFFGTLSPGGHFIRLVLGKAKKDFVRRVNEIIHDGYLDPYLESVHTSDICCLPAEVNYQLLCLVFGEGGFIRGMETNDIKPKRALHFSSDKAADNIVQILDNDGVLHCSSIEDSLEESSIDPGPKINVKLDFLVKGAAA